MPICDTTDLKYSIITLLPKDKEERKLFWDFRCQDISQLLPFFVGYNALFWTVYLFGYI